jgi:hypothetical protein
MKVRYDEDVDPQANLHLLLQTLFLCGKFLSAEYHEQVSSVMVLGLSECLVGTGEPKKYLNYQIKLQGNFISSKNPHMGVEVLVTARVDRATLSNVSRISLWIPRGEGDSFDYQDAAQLGFIEKAREKEYLKQFEA